MTVNEAYLQFLTKVNRNLGSNNIAADKPRFVMLYNENQVKRILQVISDGNDEDIREIQTFLKPNTELTFEKKIFDRVFYLLPEDFLDFSSSYALADKNQCKNEKIDLIEIKDKNYTQVLSDNYNKPSFEYRETPIIVADSRLNVFISDFDITKVVLTYYRYPKSIDIDGYITDAGQNSADVNPEGDKRFIDVVISMAATDYARNYGDVQAVQIGKDRSMTKF